VIPFAPIRRPDQLFEDPHLNQSGGFVETTLPSGKKTKLPKLPLRMGDYEFGLRSEPPKPGEGTHEVLKSVGFTDDDITTLINEGVVFIRD
jgi:crotonobetainyl-CoA:carnitine CoA-transferase CaiB-like acyl-CoA transferase